MSEVRKVKVGQLELEALGEMEINGENYIVVKVPSPDEFKGFPPSWEWVRTRMLTWRPFFKGKMVEVDGRLVPVVDKFVLYMDPEMYELLYEIYETFKVNKPSIETNVSVVVTKIIEKIEADIGRTLTEEEKSDMYIHYAVMLAILRDVGMLN